MDDSLKELVDLFTEYSETIHELPPRDVRFAVVGTEKVLARSIQPGEIQAQEEEDEVEYEEYQLIEEAVPEADGSEEEVMYPEDFSLYFCYNAISGTFGVQFCPTLDVGFEIVGNNIDEVMGAVKKNLEGRIAFAEGDFTGIMDNLDKEFEHYVTNVEERSDGEPG